MHPERIQEVASSPDCLIRCDSFSPKKVCALSEHTLPDVLAPVAEQWPRAAAHFPASLFVNKRLHVKYFSVFAKKKKNGHLEQCE